MTSAKLSTGPSRTCAHARTWREACKAADYVLEHFGNPLRDLGLHFDAEAEEARERENSTSWLSDHGRSAAAIRRCNPARTKVLQKRGAAAIKKVQRKAPHLLPVLRLIFKNGSNREKSICEIMAKSRTRKK